MFDDISDKNPDFENYSMRLRNELTEMAIASERFGNRLTSAFVNAAVKGKSLDNVLKSLALSLSRIALKQALRPLGSAVAGLLTGAPANIKPFAKGGVLNMPAVFPLNRGLGVAGEAGPEAVLPLSRGPDGYLGVRAPNVGSAGVTITFNVNATDAESFLRSESNIAAMLNRAVSRGARNL